MMDAAMSSQIKNSTVEVGVIGAAPGNYGCKFNPDFICKTVQQQGESEYAMGETETSTGLFAFNGKPVTKQYRSPTRGDRIRPHSLAVPTDSGGIGKCDLQNRAPGEFCSPW